MSTQPLFTSGESPPSDYDRAPAYDTMIRERDVVVAMRAARRSGSSPRRS